MTSHKPTRQPAVRGGAVLGLSLLLAGLPAAMAAPGFSSQPHPSLLQAGPVVPAKGMFLVASPSLADPNFQRTVILLCEHSPEGTLGLVINRPTDLFLSEALPAVSVLKGTSYVVFAGGPVQPGGLLMLFRVVREPDRQRQVLDGVYVGGSLNVMERLITRPEPTETFRAFAGYAGWAPGQLESEMAQGSWVLRQAESSAIFDRDPAGLWSELIETVPAPGMIRTRDVMESFIVAMPSWAE
jgi:putative transcriptional regulator